MLRQLLIANVILLAAAPAQARELCGQSFANRTALERTLKANHGVKVFLPASGIQSMFGPSRTLWWFTVKPDHAFPAVVCAQQVKRHGAFVDQPVESFCGSASRKECKALAGRLANVKF